MMRNTRWTKQEDEFLIDTLNQLKNSRHKNYAAIAKILQRTEKAVKLRAQRYSKNLVNKEKEIETPKKVSKSSFAWSKKENEILLQELSKTNKYKTQNDLIQKVSELTGFSKTTVFDKMKLIQKKDKKNTSMKQNKQQKTKSTFFQRLKQLFFPNE